MGRGILKIKHLFFQIAASLHSLGIAKISLKNIFSFSSYFKKAEGVILTPLRFSRVKGEKF